MSRAPLSLLLLALGVGASACGGKPGGNDAGSDGGVPLRACDVELRFVPAQSVGAVQAGGEWNVFVPTATPLSGPDKSGAWSTRLTLPPGDYAYKLVVDGTWQLDPGNPLRKWVGGEENSVLEVADCLEPQITFARLDKSPDGRVHLEAQYVDGASGAGLDHLDVLLDGQTTAAQVAADGAVSLQASGLAQGKHRLSLRAADRAGRDARLEVPLWIEPVPYQVGDGIMYFAFTDRFRNGDVGNDSATAGVDARANYQGGDWAGITAAINEGYFDALGVRVLWISPPNQNPDGAFVGNGGYLYTGYHGYWPKAGRTTQARFGTLDDLKTLVRAAHAHGLRVVVDSVLNHVHAEHPLYSANRFAGWFHGDGSCVCGGPSCDWDTHAIDCWFTSYLPDLDYQTYAADKAMVEDALFWADEVDVDGFRVDAVKHFLHAPTRRLRTELRRRFEHDGPLYYLVGETFTGADDAGRGLIQQFIGPDELVAQFDFPIYWNVLGSLGTYGQTMRALEGACAATDSWFGGVPMSPFFGNHDVARFLSQAAGMVAADTLTQAWTAPPAMPPDSVPYERLRLALAFIYTQPGVPLVYYGDELGMPGTSDPDNRRFMKWTGLDPREQATLDHARKLGAARRALPALQSGKRATLWIDDDVYIYARTSGSDVAIVAINRGGGRFTQSVPVPAAIAPIADGVVLHDRLGGADVDKAGGAIAVDLGPRSSALWAP